LLTCLLGIGGCGGPSAPPLPAAADLLARSATATAQLKTASMHVQVDPALTTMPIRAADAKLTSTGDAAGTATLGQGNSSAALRFVITNGHLYLKGPTGGYRQLPLALAASIYDPTAVLTPDRGLPALLRTATNGSTEASEVINGAPAYRVRASFDPRLVSSLVPGLAGASSGLVWIDQASSRLVRARLDVPTTPGGPTAPVMLTLSDFDAPVDISPPSHQNGL
jgi:lipoprotein LprG